VLFLYHLLVNFLFPIIRLVSKVHPGARDFFTVREKSFQDLQIMTWNHSKLIWLHASSVGELDQAKAIAKCIREKEPTTKIVVSVFSASVKPRQWESPFFDAGFYLPLDKRSEYKKYWELLKPNTLVILAWDTWPNLVYFAKQNGTKVYLACGSIHEGSSRLRFPQLFLTKKILRMMDGISPSNPERIPLFQKLAPNVPIHSAGDSRFDSVIDKIESRKVSPKLPDSPQKVIILASTYSDCEKILFPALSNILKDGFQIWIFPHKVEEKRILEIEESLKNIQLKSERYSNGVSSNIILFDKLGILAFAYEKAHYTYVGGAFHHRVHNVLEPAYFGLPIATGPKIGHSPEALELEKNSGLKIFQTTREFLEIHSLWKEENQIAQVKKINSEFVKSQRGGAAKFYSGFLQTQ
jgi:3-deoxy-D-manno-octulosonic-acid transferase